MKTLTISGLTTKQVALLEDIAQIVSDDNDEGEMRPIMPTLCGIVECGGGGIGKALTLPEDEWVEVMGTLIFEADGNMPASRRSMAALGDKVLEAAPHLYKAINVCAGLQAAE